MAFIITKAMIYYATIVAVAAIVAALVLRRTISLYETRRSKRLKQRDAEELLSSHVDSHANIKQEKKNRLKSLHSRFTVLRRSVYIALVLLVIILLGAPVMHKVSPVLTSAVIACISVIVGMAARPFIENLICGLVLCFGRLARIGDIVLVDDQYGTIEDVTLTHCVVRRWDWLRYVVPNSTMMTKEFVNYSLHDNHRWVHVEFHVDYDNDMAVVEEIAKNSPKTSQYYSDAESPRFWVVELTEFSAKCMVVAWATTAADGWMLSIDIRRTLLDEFRSRGIKTHFQNISLQQKAHNNTGR